MDEEDTKAGESFDFSDFRRLGFAVCEGIKGLEVCAGTNAETLSESGTKLKKGVSLRRYLEEPGGLVRSFLSLELFLLRSVCLAELFLLF